ncbi:MAG: hypothetical protein HY437_01325 [Candidatus Magasanikbacteria bacterium]|nr:hypothetical protein [Candidatus Magasanikbacteria bacterium]
MFERLFRIMRKTGHRVVMVDPDTEQAYVLLPFSVYEDLLDRAGDEGDELYDDDDDQAWEHVASGWQSETEEPRSERLSDTRDAFEEMRERPREPRFEETPLPAEAPSSEGHDLTPPDLIDTINRDIAAWRAEMAGESRSPVTVTGRSGEQAPAEGVPTLDDLTLTPVPGEEASPTQNGGAEEEKFYIEPV